MFCILRLVEGFGGKKFFGEDVDGILASRLLSRKEYHIWQGLKFLGCCVSLEKAKEPKLELRATMLRKSSGV